MTYDVKHFGRIGVLMGGYSSERDISLKSGRAVVEALKSAGCDAAALDIVERDEKKIAAFIKKADLDIAFITLHGRLGEDGMIQAILEDLSIVFTGSGKEASRRAINKVMTQGWLRQHNIPVAPSFGVTNRDQDSLRSILERIHQWPVVVKPACEGSSIGVTIVGNPGALAPALHLAWQYGPEALVEQYIKGRELTVGILDQTPLPVIEIRPRAEFFDFSAKYQSGTTEYIVPADLPDKAGEDIRQTALTTHRVLGCSDLSRIDFMLDEQGRHYVLEINTIPGFTSVSLLPRAAKHRGISFEQLCLQLTALAYGKKKETGTSAVRR